MTPTLGKSVALSIVLHVILFSMVELLCAYGWWNRVLLSPEWARSKSPPDSDISLEIQQPTPFPKQEPTLSFVEVSPTQATEAAPKDPKFYSSLNSEAANPDTHSDGKVPKIDGTQDKVPRTTDSARITPPPAVPPPSEKQSEETLATPLAATELPIPKSERLQVTEPSEKSQKPGDLAFLKAAAPIQIESKPDETLIRTLDTQSQPRQSQPRIVPRKLAQVQPPESQAMATAGSKFKQSGGVGKFGLEPSFDVKATEFGAYDARIVAAIQRRWYDLLEARYVPPSRTGRVVLEFHLTADGRIVNMVEKENNVSSELGLICQRAVQEPGPYGAWSKVQRQLVGKDYREVRFTFYYN